MRFEEFFPKLHNGIFHVIDISRVEIALQTHSHKDFEEFVTDQRFIRIKLLLFLTWLRHVYSNEKQIYIVRGHFGIVYEPIQGLGDQFSKSVAANAEDKTYNTHGCKSSIDLK